MRISDWSSDVCSSDLVGGVVDLVAQAAAAFKNKAALISGNSSLTFGEVVSRIHALAGLVAQHSARGDRVVVVMNNGANAALLPRSEEHTSELQSLMRISYAVFCLKKKKQ